MSRWEHRREHERLPQLVAFRLARGVGGVRSPREVDVGREACGSEDAVERVDSGDDASRLVGRQRRVRSAGPLGERPQRQASLGSGLTESQ